MWFFKKKAPKEVIDSKFQIGEVVNFRYKGDLRIGKVYNVEKDSAGVIKYSVQIGGECPVVIEDVKEEALIKKNK